jgi:putative N6-adenine-specific DNA methylase
VHFEADENLYLECHLKLRTASRLLRVLRECPAQSMAMLLDQAKRVEWEDVIGVDQTFMIDAVTADGKESTVRVSELCKQVRVALMDTFEKRYGNTPRVDTEDPDLVFVAHLRLGKCTICVDTSGKSLHKRGYRGEGHPAPLKETLAAAILRLAGYDGSQNFLDPMCGSGTLAIEACMVALNKASQIHRRKGEFGFEHLRDFDKGRWREIQERVRLERREEPSGLIAASDISARFVEAARENALRARVEKHMTFQVKDFRELVAPAPTGLLVANLPYGTRIDAQGEELVAFYKQVGDTLKRNFQGWRAALLVAKDSPGKFIGLKPSRKIPLLNGSIPAQLLIFDIRPWVPRTVVE